jgi:hypothetical protein
MAKKAHRTKSRKTTTKKPASAAKRKTVKARRVRRAAETRFSYMGRLVGAVAECLEMPEAIALVKGCLGGNLPSLDTTLGDLFPDPAARSQFCQCVASGAGVDRSRIPCSAGTTLREVIDAIAC